MDTLLGRKIFYQKKRKSANAEQDEFTKQKIICIKCYEGKTWKTSTWVQSTKQNQLFVLDCYDSTDS